MGAFLAIIGLIFLTHLAVESFFKFSNDQVGIAFMGFYKIPKVVLELAGINKGSDTPWDDFTKEEKERFQKINEKIHNAVFSTLTYIRSHNLIHVQKKDQSYFHKITDDNRYLIYEKLGELPNKSEVYYVLYRRDNGWLRGANLIGYLLKSYGWACPEKKEVTKLFEFPEKLITKRFFTRGLQKKYNLKGDFSADYLEKDELGYGHGVSNFYYETENKEWFSFWFTVT